MELFFIDVDDCFLFSYVESAEDNMTAALKVHTEFLGDDATDDEKSSKKPSIDRIAIGWYMNFETATISSCGKVMDKLKFWISKQFTGNYNKYSAKLINLYAGLVPQPSIWSIQELSKDMERIIKRFDKSNMISLAKDKAADTILDKVLI
jgi:hypothetical protein